MIRNVPINFLDSRVIRVFVSSTFRDLHDEREQLEKIVFPQIKKLCAKRAVTFVSIDLRSGISEKRISAGELLPICFAEIDRCRPFFIGILADRYGSIPNITAEVLHQHHWIKPFRGRSITELEIRYGALNSCDRNAQAFFYFREPADDSSLESNRLRLLEEDIRNGGFPLTKYRNAAELGELVLQSLTELIDGIFPTEQANFRGVETQEHEAFLFNRTSCYFGRQRESKRFENAMRKCRHGMILTGPEGSGKSALLANWVKQQRKANPSGALIFHVVTASHYSSNVPAMLRRILTELMFQCDVSGEIQDWPTPSDLYQWLSRAAAKGPLTVVIDGIEHLDISDYQSPTHWLPNRMPDLVRVVLVGNLQLNRHWLARGEWDVFEVSPLTQAEITQVCNEFLTLYGRRLDQDEVQQIATTPASANVLFLKTLLNEIRLFGRAKGLEQMIARFLNAPDLTALMNLVLARYEEDFERHRQHLVRDVMRLLWASRQGLSEEDLRNYLGTQGEPLPQAFCSPLFLACESALVYRRGRLFFAHESWREAIRKRYLNSPEEEARARSSLVHFVLYRSDYAAKLRELPWQLFVLGDWANLIKPLTDPQFFESLWTENKWELRRFWSALENYGGANAAEAYASAIKNPEGFGNPKCIWFLSFLLGDLGYIVEAIDLRQWLADYYRHTHDEVNLIATLGITGTLLGRLGRTEEALAMFREQEQVGRRIGDLNQVQLALANMGNALLSKGDRSGARQAYTQHKKLCDELGDRESLRYFYNGFGQIQRLEGDLLGAFESFRRCSEIANEINDLAMGQAAIGNQGTVLMDLGDVQEAQRFLELQESICRDINHREGLVGALGNRGVLLREMGDPQAALALHNEETRIARQIGFAYGLRQGLAHQGETLLTLNRLEESLEYYLECAEYSQLHNDTQGLYLAWHQASVVLERQGVECSQKQDFSGAREKYRRMIEVAQENQEVDLIVAGQLHMVRALQDECRERFENEDYVAALSLLREIEQILKDQNDAEGVAQCLFSQGDVVQQWAERDYEEADLQGKLAIFQERERIGRSLGLGDDVKENLDRQWILHMHLSAEHYEADMINEALAAAAKAQAIDVELENQNRLMTTLSHMLTILDRKAELELQRNAFAAALNTFQEAERIARAAGDDDHLKAALHNQTVVRIMQEKSRSS
jgi:hypothetical protein